MTVESEAAIYLTPYMDLEPESLFLAFVDGEMVGYLTGCLDSTRLPTESERFDGAIKEYRLFLRPKPMLFFAPPPARRCWRRSSVGATTCVAAW
jgi:hypothetical protein